MRIPNLNSAGYFMHLLKNALLCGSVIFTHVYRITRLHRRLAQTITILGLTKGRTHKKVYTRQESVIYLGNQDTLPLTRKTSSHLLIKITNFRLTVTETYEVDVSSPPYRQHTSDCVQNAFYSGTLYFVIVLFKISTKCFWKMAF